MSLTSLRIALGNDPQMFLATILSLAGLIAATAIAVGICGSIQWRIHCQNERDTEFKRELLSNGFSVDEVERILRASSAKAERSTPRFRHSLRSRKAMSWALHRRA